MPFIPTTTNGTIILLVIALVWFGKLLVDKIFPGQAERIATLEKNQAELVKELKKLRDEVDEWQAKYWEEKNERTKLQGQYDLIKYELNQIRHEQSR